MPTRCDIGHTDVLVVTDKALKKLTAERALSSLVEAGVNHIGMRASI